MPLWGGAKRLTSWALVAQRTAIYPAPASFAKSRRFHERYMLKDGLIDCESPAPARVISTAIYQLTREPKEG